MQAATIGTDGLCYNGCSGNVRGMDLYKVDMGCMDRVRGCIWTSQVVVVR